MIVMTVISTKGTIKEKTLMPNRKKVYPHLYLNREDNQVKKGNR